MLQENSKYNLEHKLDIIISILGKTFNKELNMEIAMHICPDCANKRNTNHETINFSLNLKTGSSAVFNTGKFAKYGSILEDNFMANTLFNSASINRCAICKKEYCMCFYYNNGKTKGLTFKTEDFKELTTEYYVSADLVNYLPSEDLRTRYCDVKKIVSQDISNEAKIALIRPLIEAFLNERNNTTENNNIRNAIKELKDNELESSLHKIVDDTLKGVHIKQTSLKNNPKEVLELLETLFTKLYKIPKEEEKLKQEFESKKQLIQESFQKKLQGIRK